MPTLLPHRNLGTGSPLSEQDWQGFFNNGYCVIKSLLSPEEVIENKKALKKLIRNARKLASTLGSDFDGRVKHQGSLFVLKNNAQSQLQMLYRVCGCGSSDPTLLETSRHPKLLKAFADIMLSETFEHIICQFHPKEPGDNVSFQPHRDVEFRLHCDPNWQDANGWGSYVVAVIAIDAAGPENGGLQVVPGSHHHVTPESIVPACDNFDPEWKKKAISPQLQAGDVLMMHPYLVHWSQANTSNHSRFSLLSGVCSIGANHENYPGDCTNEIIAVK